MGKFSEIAAAGGSPDRNSLPEVWKEHFPMLCEALFPAPGKPSGTFQTPKFSITLFSEGTRLKAVVGSKNARNKWWGTLDGPELVLESIEEMLVSGKGDWREAAEQD